SARLNRPSPARAPAARRNGMAGSGSPICSASTQPKTTRYPCRTRTSMTPSITLRQDIRLIPVRSRATSTIAWKATGGDSPPRDVRQLPRRRLDRGARLEQHRRRVPRHADKLVAGAVRHSRLDHAVAEADLLLLHVHRHRRLRRPADLALEPLDVLLRGAQAGDAEHHAVAEEDLAEGAAYNSADAPPHEGLWRVFTRRAAPEILTHDQHRRALVDLLVERVLEVLLLGVLEGVLAHALEGHGLQE